MNCKLTRIMIMYIYENLSKIKIEFKRFLFDHQNPHEGLKLFESYFTTYYIIASQSFSQYMSRKILMKRKLIAWALNINLWIQLIKYSIIYIIDEPWIYHFFGDPLYLFGRPDVIFLLLFLSYLISATLGMVQNLFFTIIKNLLMN
jgi:hypothetical protein